MEDKVAYLQMIQSVINRMGANSFLLKGWTVTLVSALFALAAKDANQTFIMVAFFPAIIFWILDGYFLSQERLYRALYDHARTAASPVDFSLNTSPFKNSWNSWPNATFSRTLIIFYSSILVIILIVVFVS
jgi:hypothetical protein